MEFACTALKTDAGGEADGQGLDGADPCGILGGAAFQDPEHLAELEELDEPQPDREIDADGEQPVDEDIFPKDQVQKIDDRRHFALPHAALIPSW